MHFTDVTAAAGIHFRHVNGATGQKYIPETMGSGCAFLDYDGDGRLDLFFVNSGGRVIMAAATRSAITTC